MSARRLLVCLLLLGFAIPAPAATAEDWPTRPVRLIVPYPPGGSSDVAARLFSQKLGERLGQQIVVDNRGSAGGVVGADLLARSAPDGYTLGLANAASQTAAPLVFSNVTYHPLSSFAYIAFIGTVPAVLIAHPSFPARSVADLVKLARAQPGKIDFGTAGNGSVGHIVGEMFKLMTGTHLTHVPYRGTGFMIVDLRTNAIPLGFDALAPHQENIKAGVVRALAIAAAKRVAMAPDIPTFAEQGYPGVIGEQWLGLAAPAGLPRHIVERLHSEMTQLAKEPEIAERLVRLGITHHPFSPAEFTGYVGKQYERWKPVVKAAKVTVN